MIKFFKAARAKIAMLTLALVVLVAGNAMAAPPNLDVSGFTISGAFSHANLLLNALMPVALIGFGIGLAFVVLRFIRSLI